MRHVPGRGGHGGEHLPRRRSPLLLATAVVVMALLGPLAALAAATGSTGSTGSGSGGSGGSGLPGATTGTTVTDGTTITNSATGTITTPTTTTGAYTTTTTTPPPPAIAVPKTNPFASRGMWIWELPMTDGGDLSTIIAQARQYGIGTIYVKSGDGTTMWSQFNRTLVTDLHEAGIHVCAWQYVYGVHPLAEAKVGAQAVKDGADCLVIDAESQYQGLYAQAQEYIGQLRARIGSRFPLALAGFPYVDFHPSFPYSVFLGTNGAQYNLPQMYWADIGVSVSAVYQHTYEFNELYQRPIFPLGQLFDLSSTSGVLQFRAISRYYGATGTSWWDWQSASSSLLAAVAKPVGGLTGFVAQKQVASIGLHAVGDLVVWAQEHLWDTPERVAIDGDYGPATEAAVEAFQTANGIAPTGVITPQTWSVLLKEPVPKVRWSIVKKQQTATVA